MSKAKCIMVQGTMSGAGKSLLCAAPVSYTHLDVYKRQTDACLELLDSAGLRAPVLESLLRAVQLHLDRRACGAFRVGAVLFSNQHGPLGATDTAAQLLDEWKEH